MCGAVKELWQARIEQRADRQAARLRAHLVTRFGNSGHGRGVVTHESAWTRERTQTTIAATAAWVVSRRVARQHPAGSALR